MKLGIVITSYNNQDTLAKVIKSVAKFKKKNYIVLVDDCSTDSSIEIANQAKKNKQIDSIHLNKKNLGVSSCRNIGINLCKNTDYITFVDGDDFLNSNSFNIINKKKVYGDLIVFNFDYLNENRISKNYFYNKDKKLFANDIKKYFYNYLNKPNKNSLFTTCWAKFYKTKILTSNKKTYFNEKMYLCEDTDFVFRFLSEVKSVQYINSSIYSHSVAIGKKNLNKPTFGTKLNLVHQISFLKAVESCKKYLIKNGDNLSIIQNKLDHCIGAYTIIYTIRSCIKINSLSSFIKTYLFWKNIYKRKQVYKSIINYSPELANGGLLIPYLIKKEAYFLAVLIAYFSAKKRYL